MEQPGNGLVGGGATVHVLQIQPRLPDVKLFTLFPACTDARMSASDKMNLRRRAEVCFEGFAFASLRNDVTFTLASVQHSKAMLQLFSNACSPMHAFQCTTCMTLLLLLLAIVSPVLL